MLYNTFGKRTHYKPDMPWGLDELTSSRQRERGTEGGVLFALKGNRNEKSAARQMVLDIFHPERYPSHLSMLTMPGVDWTFERKLLETREGDWMNRAYPKKTHFITVENNRSIFSASIQRIPGIYKSTIKETAPRSFAEIGFKTNFVAHFFCNIDDFMEFDNWDNDGGGWNAAWLDYTGPLSVERLSLIQRFYSKYLKQGTLIITALRARWNKATSDAINNAGSYSKWLRQNLEGEVLHDIEYIDTSPMAQFAVAHIK